jgi:hypothetical protein
LNASEVVAALAMNKTYMPIWEYVKRFRMECCARS